jgi:rhodanese-related sulfurtransferase
MFGLKKRPPMPEVDPQFVIQTGPELLLLDVREPHEFEAGHAAPAYSAPLSTFDTWVKTLPTDRTIICMCRSGRRSTEATERLRRAGFEAGNLTGGIAAWVGARFAVVTSAGLPGRVL